MRRLLRRLRRAFEALLQFLGRRLCRAVLALRLREWRADELGQPAIVFAPHPDDEVLGCGGTIIRKRRAGAAVTVVFMTDGSASHPELMSGEEMKRLRAAEALAACGVLGVASEHVIFLDFPDGRMGEQLSEAVQRVRELLDRLRPAEVFIPHYHDGSPDHLATTTAVLAAANAYHGEATVYEYPVWLWCHWPWIALPGNLGEIPETLRKSVEANWRLLRDCRCYVPVGDILELKREALQQHRTQVDRHIPDPRWFTLADVSNGLFLECFFDGREIFYRHRRCSSAAPSPVG